MPERFKVIPSAFKSKEAKEKWEDEILKIEVRLYSRKKIRSEPLYNL